MIKDRTKIIIPNPTCEQPWSTPVDVSLTFFEAFYWIKLHDFLYKYEHEISLTFYLKELHLPHKAKYFPFTVKFNDIL